MKKIILTTTLTSLCINAFAQDYNPYEYNYEPYKYEKQVVQEELYPDRYPDIYQERYPDIYQERYPDRTYQPYSAHPEKEWNASVILGLGYVPEYDGAKDNEYRLVINPNFEYKINPWNKLFLSLGDTLEYSYGGAGYSYNLSDNIELGLGVGYREGRDSGDAAILAGMEDVDDTLTYLAFAKYNYNNFDFSVKMEKGFDSANDGITTELAASFLHQFTPRITLRTTLSTVYSDSDYMKQNFKISGDDVTAQRPFHETDSGFSEVNLGVLGNYNIRGPHNVVASAKVTKYFGDAKDSPVVEDDMNYGFFGGYRYEF